MAGLMLLLLSAGCAPGPPPPTPPPGSATAGSTAGASLDGDRRPDLVLVTIDRWRADAPALPLAEHAVSSALPRPPDVRFTAAYVHSVQPYVSLVTMLVGRLPSAVPVCGRPILALRPQEREWCTRVPPRWNTLPAILGAYGYAAALATVGDVGVDDAAELFPEHLASADMGSAVPALSAWWTAHAGAPRLLVVAWAPVGEGNLAQAAGLRLADSAPVSAAGVGQLRAAYLEGARKAGTLLAALMTSLDGPHWTFVTGLRGVSLGEPGGNDQVHQVGRLTSDALYERTLHVPLWVYAPTTGAAVVRDEVVEAVDLFPTLLSLARARPSVDAQGVDRLGDPALPSAAAWAEFGDMIALREGATFAVWRNFLHGATSLDPRVTETLCTDLAPAHLELWDVEHDPWQERPLAESDPDRARAARARLCALKQTRAALPDDAITAERRAALRKTGPFSYW